MEDALHATRAAVEEGIVPDGVAALRAASALHGLKGDGDEHIGIDIIRSSCEEALPSSAETLVMKAPSSWKRSVPRRTRMYGFNVGTSV